MSDNHIVFNDVSKTYTIKGSSSYGSLRDDLTAMFSFNKKKDPIVVNALKNISLTIPKGENVSFIGHNGAGKSTILKLIASITQPTSGQLNISGRVACLMELGAGFHLELSGRENIAFFGAILGMKKKDVIELSPLIIEFAELHDFIDIPMKKYSSGMQLRLGFSIAIHVQPDILLLDEILAVGDEKFQIKCLKKIEESFSGDTTVILISHHESSVRQVAERVVLLDKGSVILDSNPDEAFREYKKMQDIKQ
jgi:lipopolysaccharide transport system ATP-binding protein